MSPHSAQPGEPVGDRLADGVVDHLHHPLAVEPAVEQVGLRMRQLNQRPMLHQRGGVVACRLQRGLESLQLRGRPADIHASLATPEPVHQVGRRRPQLFFLGVADRADVITLAERVGHWHIVPEIGGA